MSVWMLAERSRLVLNALGATGPLHQARMEQSPLWGGRVDEDCFAATPARRVLGQASPVEDEAQHRWWRRLLSRAAVLARARRALGRTGVHALADLLRLEVNRYSVRPKSVPQVPFIAEKVDEPASDVKIMMLVYHHLIVLQLY